MNGLQASPHRGREVRSYTANRRELRFGVVAVEGASGWLLTMWIGASLPPKRVDCRKSDIHGVNVWISLEKVLMALYLACGIVPFA